MKSVQRRTRVLLLVLLAVVIGGTFIWFWANWLPQVIVSNQSGRTIQELTITFDSTTYRFENLSPGESKTIHAIVKHDTDIQIHGRMADGTAIEDTGGYFTEWIIKDQRQSVIIGVDGAVTFQ